jgi:hypothetical protein
VITQRRNIVKVLEVITRREFLRRTALGGAGIALGLNSCSPYSKNVKWNEVPDSEFSISKFDEWFFFHKIYNGINPNLKTGHTGYSPTFKGSMDRGFTPGTDYSSNYMYAAADGIVLGSSPINTSKTGRLGGLIMYISHGSHTHGTIFRSLYAHLDTAYVKLGDFVQRGDKLASVMDKDHAKLMIHKSQNLVDPDNYGINHSYMTYWDGTKITNDDIDQKNMKQLQIVGEISKMCSEELDLYPRDHKRLANYYVQGCIWDQIEIFRYLDALYDARSRLFPELSPDKFAEYKKEFYANQPIIFTLPLRP